MVERPPYRFLRGVFLAAMLALPPAVAGFAAAPKTGPPATRLRTENVGYDNEIALLGPVRPDGRLQTLFRPQAGRFVGEIDLHFDADRLLFTMPNGRTWQIHEIRTDGSGLRQVSRGEHADVDNFDACYLPDGGIVRQLCFDQDLDLHPSVLPNGQVIFSRWDYTGPLHIYLRPLMVMNPDGTGQRAAYGSNSYWPNAFYFPRGIPEAPNKIVAVVAGPDKIGSGGPCHGTWADVCPVPEGADRRRWGLSRLYGGPQVDPEAVVAEANRVAETNRVAGANRMAGAKRSGAPGLGQPRSGASQAQPPATPNSPVTSVSPVTPISEGATVGDGEFEKTLDLGDGVTMQLVRIPAGEFVMGSCDGAVDERPRGRV